MLDPSGRRTVGRRSRRNLETARLALNNGDPESAASRPYYALYHVTVLLLETVRNRHRDRWDHQQLHQAFLQEFCRSGYRFTAQDGADWRYVMSTRLRADYSRRTEVNASYAGRCVARSASLVEKMVAEIDHNV